MHIPMHDRRVIVGFHCSGTPPGARHNHFLTKRPYWDPITVLNSIYFNGIQTVRASIQENQQPSRSEPSSRTFLIGEQPNAWDLLQPRAKVSRHRGAELRRRYGRLGGTSLLSPG